MDTQVRRELILKRLFQRETESSSDESSDHKLHKCPESQAERASFLIGKKNKARESKVWETIIVQMMTVPTKPMWSPGWGDWEALEALRDGAYWEITGGVPLLLLLLLLPGRRGEALLYHVLLPCCADVPQAKSHGAKQSDTANFQTVSQNEPFLFVVWLIRVFCCNNRKLTNTEDEQVVAPDNWAGRFYFAATRYSLEGALRRGCSAFQSLLNFRNGYVQRPAGRRETQLKFNQVNLVGPLSRLISGVKIC